ncbi:MAG: protein kinase [Gemmatimonadetes bacterium]|nr:protein kinase [Gemmatimonadota bacterium]
MSTLAERLGAALAPRYRLGEEVGAGGMARVFRAEDSMLARPVAVKVLRPELATAVASERFLREARALAAVAHPNVMTIHECGEVDGLLFYVMDFEQARSLRQCLDEGPCPEADAWRLGVDLSAALEATHASGVIHRDVKPGNIFLRPDRAVLADFGIASDASESEPPLTQEGSPGTPAYMAPEQAAGDVSTERSDIYSAAMVLYEAFSGRRWARFQDPGRADWSGIPRRARPVLSRALELDPARRWPDATTFHGALRQAHRRRPTARRVSVVGLGALALFLVWWSWPKPPPAVTADLAVLPCSAGPGVDPEAARVARSWAASQLDNLRDIHVLSERQTLNTWDRHVDRLSSDDWQGWTEALRARWVSSCGISAAGDTWRVAVELHDGVRSEGPYLEIAERGDSTGTGQAVFHAMLQALGAADLTAVSVDEAGVLSSYSSTAVLLWIEGKEYFRQDALRNAVHRFTQALALEPEFALAEWHLAEAQRWLAHAAVEVNLQDLYRNRSSELPVRDSMLLEARVALYDAKPVLLRAVAEKYPDEAYPTLLYADELYHRGGLWGEPVDSAVALLESAVDKDSSLIPAVEHLAQAQIRLGRGLEARRTLEYLDANFGPWEQHEVYYPAIWQQAWLQRFAGEDEAAQGFEQLVQDFGPEGTLELLRLGCRWVRYVEIPSGQEMLGRALRGIARDKRSPDDAAGGLLAIALGKLGQGRITSALASFDSIVAETRTPEARLQARMQAAEWRVIPYALGLDGFGLADAEAGSDTLAALWTELTGVQPILRERAAFGLAILAAQTDPNAEAAAWSDSLRALESSLEPGAVSRQSQLLAGLSLASAGELDLALESTDSLVTYDSVALGADPFGRAATYWLRARWQAEAGDTIAALRTLYWHENTDLEEGTAAGLVQAAEVDAAFGVHARAMTVELAGRLTGDGSVAGLPGCVLVQTRGREVMRLWSDPDPGLLPVRRRVEAVLEQIESECET